MKVAFLVEYFHPFVFGGSEISTFYLARGLENLVDILVIAPNFGTKNREAMGSIKIIRYPFPKKIEGDKSISPFWHSSLILSLYKTLCLIKLYRKERFDLIHVHEKYLLIPGYLASRLLNIPLVVTIRDYQVLCNYGFCINKKRNYKTCNFVKYWTEDFKFFLKNYSSGNIIKNVILIFAAIRARLITKLNRIILKRVDRAIYISKKEKYIYAKNGFTKGEVIYNPVDFEKLQRGKKGNYILYAGKISRGKGVDILIKTVGLLASKYKNINFIIAGSGELSSDSKEFLRKNNLGKSVKFLGKIDHVKLMNLYQKAKLTIVPSFWEEPFGRSALESIASGTPVVSTNVGGLPEIVEDKKTGIITDPNPTSLAKAIQTAIKNHDELSKNIRKSLPSLKKKFSDDVFKSHIKLYKELLK